MLAANKIDTHALVEIIDLEKTANNHKITIQIPLEFMKYVFSKGFIALDGASLTIVDVDYSKNIFSVWLIPETLRLTTFGFKKVEDKINFEIETNTRAMVDNKEKGNNYQKITGEKRVAIVAGAFHRENVEKMVAEAKEVAKSLNIKIMEVVWVHGSLEKPLALKRLLSRNDIDGAVALGIIERGETKHGLVMGQTVMSAIINLQLEYNKPIGVGILGPEIELPQIYPRLLPYAREAVVAVNGMLLD